MSGGWAGSTRRDRLPRDWPERRSSVLERDDYRCQLRYRGVCAGRATDVDHRDRGDDHRLANLQAACSPCHSRKSSAEGNAARPARKQPITEAHPGLIAIEGNTP